MTHHPTSTILLGLAAMAAWIPNLSAADYWVYYGTSNGGAGKGISLGHFNSDTGVLSKPELAVEADGPSFLTMSSDGKHLYSCWENADKVAAYAIEAKTGALKFLDAKESGGSGPCYISLDKTNRFALVANYQSGGIAVLPINPTGSLDDLTHQDSPKGEGPNTVRQSSPHAHSVITDPTNQYVLHANLGTDQIYVYRFDNKDGKLTSPAPNWMNNTGLKSGSGPRHLLFHPNGKVLYCINEMGGTVTGFNWDGATGTLTEFQTISTLPADFKGTNTDAELAIHPNGNFLYASARGHDAIAVFAIDPKTFALSLVQDISSGGKTPRFFSFDPTGRWIIAGNQGSNTAVVFKVDDKTGKLTPQGDPVPAPAPICMLFFPAAKAAVP